MLCPCCTAWMMVKRVRVKGLLVKAEPEASALGKAYMIERACGGVRHSDARDSGLRSM